ncbi:hypothetical protein FACS1894185_7120 [Betaproteobacteria bacterium]|nr:hypothetical protein FACS1894185_7120 [Betaproteobacteria bacterium]
MNASPRFQAGFAKGASAIGRAAPMSLDAWARAHFYLSAESSYVEQSWSPWSFQRGIMCAMSNDDIREIDFKKSARIGYTKMLLAFICYTAHHKRRNQIIWQPSDEDSDEFVKTEIEPALRDIPSMRDVMPNVHRRNRDNTLQAKRFIGSTLHTKGGKAAKNYRRLSVDCALFDELSAFDLDVEKEGDPFTLGAKRVEGATFPKIICGSTPIWLDICSYFCSKKTKVWKVWKVWNPRYPCGFQPSIPSIPSIPCENQKSTSSPPFSLVLAGGTSFALFDSSV